MVLVKGAILNLMSLVIKVAKCSHYHLERFCTIHMNFIYCPWPQAAS